MAALLLEVKQGGETTKAKAGRHLEMIELLDRAPLLTIIVDGRAWTPERDHIFSWWWLLAWKRNISELRHIVTQSPPGREEKQQLLCHPVQHNPRPVCNNCFTINKLLHTAYLEERGKAVATVSLPSLEQCSICLKQ